MPPSPFNTNRRISSIVAVIAVPLLSFSSYSSATPFTYSGVRVLGFNEIEDSSYYGTDVVPEAFDYSGGVAVLDGSIEFAGVDLIGNAAAMSLVYAGQAQASSGGLKAQISGSLTNPFANAALNTPFVFDTDFNTNPGGVPGMITLESSARLRDTLTVSGASDLAYVTFMLGIDGSIDGGYTQLYKYATASTDFDLLYNNGEAGDFDDLVVTSEFAVIDGVVDFDFMLNTVIDFDLSQFEWEDGFGTSIAGDVDFFNTITFNQIIGYNMDGQQVDLSGASGSDGFTFATARVATQAPGEVPEPLALTLFGIGMLSLYATNRRRAGAAATTA